MPDDLFDIRYRKGLPDELKRMQDEVEQVARAAGLDFFPVVYEMVDAEEMSMLAAYGGFPTRYPHWRFGMEYEQLHKSYEYGLSKIYEMVINTDPCYAYLLNVNTLTDQKLVMAHVYGHCDFFKNNLYFAHTNRKMIDEMANHAVRVRRIVDRFGQARVEEFIDCCLSVENLVDLHSAMFRRQPEAAADPVLQSLRDEAAAGGTPELPDKRHFKADVDKSYLDDYINPPGEVERRRVAALQASLQPKRVPEHPERDVLGFILDHGSLLPWEAEILSIIRQEALYFAPQGQTKIMNEGWATFWHTKLMTEQLAHSAEIITYADHHSGTVAMSPYKLNPYKLGLELFRDIEARWNRGRHGFEFDRCDDMVRRREWDTRAMAGLGKVFEVRRIYNDLQFVDSFLTEDFCREHGFFAYGYDKTSRQYVIETKQFGEIKARLLDQLTNFGQPIIEVVDANFENRGELLLVHRHTGNDLQLDWAGTTLGNLVKLWKRPVALLTKDSGKPIRLRHDGEKLHRVPVPKDEEPT